MERAERLARLDEVERAIKASCMWCREGHRPTRTEGTLGLRHIFSDEHGDVLCGAIRHFARARELGGTGL